MSKRPQIDALQLYDYLTGGLDAAARQRIDAALEADPALRRRLEALAEVHDALTAEADRKPPPVDAALHRRILAEAETVLSRRPRLRLWRFSRGRRRVTWLGRAAAAAAALLLAAGTWALFHGGRPAGPSTALPPVVAGDAIHTPALPATDLLVEGQVLRSAARTAGGQLACGAAVLLDRGGQLTVVRSNTEGAMLRLDRGQVFCRNAAGNLQIATSAGTVTCYGTAADVNLRLAERERPDFLAWRCLTPFLALEKRCLTPSPMPCQEIRSLTAEPGAVQMAEAWFDDLPGGTVTDAPAGPDLNPPPQLWLTVVRGVVVFSNGAGAGHTTVRGGETIRVDGFFDAPAAASVSSQRAIAWTLSDEQLATLPPSVLGEVMSGSVAKTGRLYDFHCPLASRRELDDFTFHPAAARASLQMAQGLEKPAGASVPLMVFRPQFADIDEVAWWGYLESGRPQELFVNVADAAQIELRFDGSTCRLTIITPDGRTPAGAVRMDSPRYRVRFAREDGRWTLRCNDAVTAALPAAALPQSIPGRVSLTFTTQPARLIGLEVRGALRPDWLRAALAE